MSRLIEADEYLDCLPAAWQAQATPPPTSEWWAWRDMRVHLACARQLQAKARLVVYPAQDRGTPPAMSLVFLRCMASPLRHVPLQGCGHFPVEEPGITTLVETLRGVYRQVTGGEPAPDAAPPAPEAESSPA